MRGIGCAKQEAEAEAAEAEGALFILFSSFYVCFSIFKNFLGFLLIAL